MSCAATPRPAPGSPTRRSSSTAASLLTAPPSPPAPLAALRVRSCFNHHSPLHIYITQREKASNFYFKLDSFPDFIIKQLTFISRKIKLNIKLQCKGKCSIYISLFLKVSKKFGLHFRKKYKESSWQIEYILYILHSLDEKQIIITFSIKRCKRKYFLLYPSILMFSLL